MASHDIWRGMQTYLIELHTQIHTKIENKLVVGTSRQSLADSNSFDVLHETISVSDRSK